MNFKIKSITGLIHDTSFGGYPYKIRVVVEIPVKDFNKKCPITGPAKTTLFGRQPARRDLGNLVLEVNNQVYSINQNIPAHSPSIDSKGSKRSVNGVKTLVFDYFLTDHTRAENLGFRVRRFKNGECMPEYGQSVNIDLSESLTNQSG